MLRSQPESTAQDAKECQTKDRFQRCTDAAGATAWLCAGGNPLPVVWTPPQRLRDDRELVRARVDASDDTTRIKLQILSMLKRYEILKPCWYTTRWSKRYVKWLRDTAAEMAPVVAPVLGQSDRPI